MPEGTGPSGAVRAGADRSRAVRAGAGRSRGSTDRSGQEPGGAGKHRAQRGGASRSRSEPCGAGRSRRCGPSRGGGGAWAISRCPPAAVPGRAAAAPPPAPAPGAAPVPRRFGKGRAGSPVPSRSRPSPLVHGLCVPQVGRPSGRGSRALQGEGCWEPAGPLPEPQPDPRGGEQGKPARPRLPRSENGSTPILNIEMSPFATQKPRCCK